MSTHPVRYPGQSSALERLEQRTLFSGYSVSVVTPLPALSTTFVNTQPSALVRDSAGNFYGVLPQGGAGTYGTVFEVNPTTRAFTVLYTFDGTNGAGPTALAIDSSGNLFGIVSYSSATGSGSTEAGGYDGKLFEITAANRSTLTFPYTFSDTTVGTAPTALAIDSSNNVDVLVQSGSNGGAVVRLSPSTGYGTATVVAELTTQHFVYSDSLAIGSDGTIYGTSADGGGTGVGDGDGTLFSIAPGASTAATLATFDSASTGSDPEGTPYVDASGNVFGTTQKGSTEANLYGGVWEYTAASGVLSAVASISDSNPNEQIYPNGGIIPDGNGNFIGTTSQSIGTNSSGGIFEANPTTHAISDVASFTTATGTGAYANLAPDGTGNFFGVTSAGGPNGDGTVFEVSPGGGGGTGGGGTTTGTSTLTSEISKDTLAANVVGGSKIKGQVAVTVTNSGASKTTGTDSVSLYASATGAFDSNSVLIGTVSSKRLPELGAGKSVKSIFSVTMLPTTAGTYTLFAETTDAAGNTMVSPAGGTVSVAAGYVTLSAAVSAVKPTLAKIGKPINFVVTIINNGNIDSTGALTVTAGLSTDGTTLAIPITTVTKSPKIRAAKATKLSIHFTLPSDLDFVDYFPFVTISQGAASTSAVGPSFSPVFGGAR